MEESCNNYSLEAIIYAFPDAMESAPSMNRDLRRQVLIDSKEPAPESLVDQAFMRIVFSAMDSINRSSGYCRKDIVDYLLDAIEDQIKSSILKQALVERLVFSCRPPPAELSGGHVLGTSIAAGVRQLAEELSVERPLEAMAGAIRRLPFAPPMVKKILLLIVSNVEDPHEEEEDEEKEDEGLMSMPLHGMPDWEEIEDECSMSTLPNEIPDWKDEGLMPTPRMFLWTAPLRRMPDWEESERSSCLGPPARFMVKQKFKVVKPK